MRLNDLVKAIILSTGLAASAKGFDYFTAVQTAQPGQLQLVEGLKHADESVDKAGNKKDVDITTAFFTPTLKLKNDRWFASLTVPMSWIDNNTADQDAHGLGDCSFQFGPHFKLGDLYILPMLEYWTPTGSYDPSSKVNTGSGKHQIGGTLNFTRVKEHSIVDLGISHLEQINGEKYKDTVQGAAGYKTERWILGGGFNYSFGDGGLENLSVGPLIRYTGKNNWHITACIEKDVYGRNTSQGWNASIRFRIPLGEKQSPPRKATNYKGNAMYAKR